MKEKVFMFSERLIKKLVSNFRKDVVYESNKSHKERVSLSLSPSLSLEILLHSLFSIKERFQQKHLPVNLAQSF